jgi:molybdopterin-containing oxidoreductase family molybdopterin binding subunit
MRAAKDIAEARSRGMKLVVIDPICSPMASKADEWVPIRPGTDGALALSMIHVLVNELGVYDRKFLQTKPTRPIWSAPTGTMRARKFRQAAGLG